MEVERVKAAITEHWRLRLAGDPASLSAAFGFYTGEIRRKAGVESKWIAGLQADGLYEATVHSVKVSSLAPQRARARLTLRTAATASGCKEWTIDYSLLKSAVGWQMSSSDARSVSC